MPILLDHQLREQIPLDIQAFPIAFYCDELAALPNRAGPVHWHPYFEIATAQSGVLDYQVGQAHTILEPGDSIFVNQNMLHGIRQVVRRAPDPLPIILFSGTIVAPESSAIYQKYILPILTCNSSALYCIPTRKWSVERAPSTDPRCVSRHAETAGLLRIIRSAQYLPYMEEIYRNLIPAKIRSVTVQLNGQVRPIQKMLSYIYENYAKQSPWRISPAPPISAEAKRDDAFKTTWDVLQ